LTFWLVVAFIFGINIGSFLNVVIWRLPRGGSIAVPQWSYCPRCEHRLGALDLIPVFSFLALGRKCRYCKAPISWRYPSIELLTGLLFVAVVWRDGATIDSIFDCLFVSVLVGVFFIDLEHFVIPDGLNVVGALIGIAHNVANIVLRRPDQFVSVQGVHLPASVVGLFAYAGVIYSIGLLGSIWFARGRRNVLGAAWEYLKENVLDWVWIALYYVGAIIPPLRRMVPEVEPLEGISAAEIEEDEEIGAMGGGDGKLAAAIGANLCAGPALLSGFLAIFFGMVAGVAMLIRDRRKLTGRTAVPFGPSMVVGALCVMFFAQNLAAGYSAYVRWVIGASSSTSVSPAAPTSPPPGGGNKM
jgi:leader peptidase (prepilin peptidase)/N-methyltransferase